MPKNIAAPHEPAGSPRRPWQEIGFALFILVTVFIAYWPALNGAYVWDDVWWSSLIHDLLQDGAGLGRMWSDPTALQQYFPVTGTTFWLDQQIWNSATTPIHVENVLWHVLSALLLWRLLFRLEVPGAKIAAAIFALHPVMVESVAWISERKNVVSMALFLGALLAYGHSVQFWRGDAVRRRWGLYFVSLGLFALALLAKTSVFALPAVLLLLAWWKTGRVRWKSDLLPSLPFFAFAIAAGSASLWLEQHHVGAAGDDWNLTWSERVLVAGRAVWFYVGKLLWPAHLSPIYPRWSLDATSWMQWLWPVLALLGLVLLLLLRKRVGRGVVAAVLFYVGALFPVIGFMNVYGMLYTFVSNRWVYLPSLGLIALADAGLDRAAGLLHRKSLRLAPATLLLAILGVLTWSAASIYRGPDEFWRVTLAENPGCWVAYYNAGTVFLNQRDFENAIANFKRALELRPGYGEAHNNLGNALLLSGKFAEAVPHYEEALKSLPDLHLIHYNLGNCLLGLGKMEEAAARYRQGIAVNSHYASLHCNLAVILYRQNNAAEAIQEYRRAIEADPKMAEAHDALGELLRQTGDVSAACEEYEKALAIDPDRRTALLNLAWTRATHPEARVRDGARAVQLARHAVELSGQKDAMALRVLAAALAESGNFTEAERTARRAMSAAKAQGDASLAESVNREIYRYRVKMTVHD